MIYLAAVNPSSSSNPNPPPLRRRFTALAKLAATALVIWLIGISIVTLDLQGRVQPSHADLFDLTFFTPKNQHRFQKALTKLGHPPPRTFDLNGNTVFFSTNYLDDRPEEVLLKYQRQFVEQKLNDRIYHQMTIEDAEDSLLTRLTGGLTPIEIGPEKIIMAGMITQNSAKDLDGLLKNLPKNNDISIFRGHRWIEIFREPGARQTTVLATWSEDNFDYDKMLTDNPGPYRAIPRARNPSQRTRQFDDNIPLCTGCTRVNTFEDMDDPRGYRSNLFITTMRPFQITTFYRDQLATRGWKETDFQKAYDSARRNTSSGDADSEVLSFSRDEQRLEIFIYPHDGRQNAVQAVYWERSQ